MQFNSILQFCIWPWEAKCTLSGVPPAEAKQTNKIVEKIAETNEKSDTEIEPLNRDPECPFPDPLDHTVHLPHESDCTQFYKCDNGVKKLFNCSQGTHFNPKLEVCDWPEDAGCILGNTDKTTTTTTTSTTTTTTSPTTTTTTTTTPTTTKTKPTTTTTTTRPTTSTTTKPTTTTTTTKPTTTTKTTEPTTTSTTTKPTTTTPTTTTTVAPPPADRDPDCPWPDPLNYTVHLPHETDCDKFYKCDNGVKKLFNCSEGTHFNPKLEVCDWPEDAGCELGNTDKTTTTTTKTTTTTTTTTTPTTPTITSTTPTTTTTNTTTTPTTTTQIPRDPECPWPNPLNDTVHLPHDTDCDKFFVCDNGNKKPISCPDGLHFNKELEICDWPWLAGCEDATPPPPQPEPGCPPDSNGLHLPHECECDKFYVCEDGEKVLYDCAEGLYYNEYTEKCDIEDNVNCNRTITTPTPPINGTVTTSESPPTGTPSPTPPTNETSETPTESPETSTGTATATRTRPTPSRTPETPTETPETPWTPSVTPETPVTPT